MNELANQYATALFDLLKGQEKEQALQGFQNVLQALRDSKELRVALCSPSFSLDEKEKAIQTIFASLSNIPHFLPFLCIVAKNHRFDQMEEITSSFQSLLNQERGTLEGILYTAFDLKEEEVVSIEKAMSERLGRKASLRVVLDHHLLGGIKVAIDGKVFDGSLRHRLKELRAQLISGGNAR